MDVYTNPPENSYKLATAFTLIKDGQAYSVWAVKTDQVTAITAAYAIIVHFIFIVAWHIIAGLIVGGRKHDSRVSLVGLTAFWNSGESWAAMIAMFGYAKNLAYKKHGARKRRDTSGLHIRPADLYWAFGLLFLATVMFGVSLAISINYGDWLKLDNAAPVSPAALVLPVAPENTQNSVGDTLKFTTMLRPSIMRALGSAEATKLHSKRRQYEFSGISNGKLSYGYTIDAEAFGLQSNFDLVQRVRGECKLVEDWLAPSTLFEESGDASYEYQLWGNSSNKVPVAGETFPQVESLHLHPSLKPGQLPGERKSTFAFVPGTACVGSVSSSSDSWYATEPVSGLPTLIQQQYKSLFAPFRIKPERPALDCTQETLYCSGASSDDSSCLALNDLPGRLPNGTALILGWHFGTPKITQMALFGGAFALQSFVGADTRGKIIDAAGSKLDDDIERLVLGAYLASKEAFRDTALIGHLPPGMTNGIIDERGLVASGGADFVLRSEDVMALRLPLLIAAPALLAGLLAVITLGKVFRRDSQNRFKLRQTALTAAHLFRIMDEKQTPSNGAWEGWKSAVPLPSRDDTPRPYVPSRDEMRQSGGEGASFKPTIAYTEDLVLQRPVSTIRRKPVPLLSVVAVNQSSEGSELIVLSTGRDGGQPLMRGAVDLQDGDERAHADEQRVSSDRHVSTSPLLGA